MSTPAGAKGATKANKGAENQLSAILGQFGDTSLPIIKEFGDQIQQALTTGGVGAQIPIIGAAQQQSRQATSRAVQGTTNQFAQMGLSRSPFAASTLAGTRLAGEQATNLIPQQVASQFISAAPDFLKTLIGSQTTGYGQLAGFGAQRDIAKGNASAQLWGQGVQALGNVAGAGAAAACWVAFAIYGDRSLSARYARHYIFDVWQGRRATLGRKVYRAVGPALAALIRRHPAVGSLLRPLFDVAVRRGRLALG